MMQRLSAGDEDEIIRRYQGGEAAWEIGAAFGRSKTTILNVLRRRQIPRRSSRPRDNRGDRNPNWKGGRYIDACGYVFRWTPEGHRLEHRLICEAPKGSVVHHRDHDRTNNAPENLEVLPSHSAHRLEHIAEQRAKYGKAFAPPPRYGRDNNMTKLTEEQVVEIRQLRGQVSQSQLASRFGVSKTAVRLIQLRRNWKRLS